mgnify:CR=1 FL=1
MLAAKLETPAAPSGALAEAKHAPDSARAQTRGGLSRRVRGAQMPDTGPAVAEASKAADPAQVRNALSALQRGVAKGREDAGNNSAES